MRFAKSILLAPALLAFAASAQSSSDAQLTVATRINYAQALASRCERINPGYAAKLAAAYAKAKTNILESMGVNPSVLAEAEAVPELASAPMVAKFDKRDVVQQQQSCEQNLSYLVDAGNATKYAAPRK